MDFVTKDSGKREEFTTGMVRDVQTDKPRYDLVDWPMVKRWAKLMARGAVKYGENNWKKAATQAELDRFKASALRHCIQYFNGDIDEDHGAAVYFNIAGAEMVKERLSYAETNKATTLPERGHDCEIDLCFPGCGSVDVDADARLRSGDAQ